MSISEKDLEFLQRAVDLARTALEHGEKPYGSVLVSEAGQVLFEDHNHAVALDPTEHPEFAIARWAGRHLTPSERASATVYTSGEHCPMCSAAHGWAGLGRIVYAVSSAQLSLWLADWGAAPAPVTPYPISAIVPGVVVDGPAPELEAAVRALQEQFLGR